MYHLPRPGRAGRGPDGREGERDGHHISKTAPNDMRNSTAAATSTTYHGLKWHRVGQRTHCDFQICESTRLALCHQSASLCWWRDARFAKKSYLSQPFRVFSNIQVILPGKTRIKSELVNTSLSCDTWFLLVIWGKEMQSVFTGACARYGIAEVISEWLYI